MDTRCYLTFSSNILSACYSGWFPRFPRLTIIFNTLIFQIASLVWNQILMELIKKQEYYMSIHQSDHNIGSNNFHLNYHFFLV